jgi:hypothetical protein
MYVFCFPHFGQRRRHIRHRNVASLISPSSDPSVSAPSAAVSSPQDAELQTAVVRCMMSMGRRNTEWRTRKVKGFLYHFPQGNYVIITYKSSRPFLDMAYLIEGHALAQLVEALRYKSEGRGFDSRLYHWNLSLT